MEKGMENCMSNVFFITGAESTGKSTLTGALSAHFSAVGIQEYARNYLENLGRPYRYADVEVIARQQIDLINQYRSGQLVFFDTCLLNLKVWFQEVYHKVPVWLTNDIPEAGQGVYLLCEPDLPWEFDPLRENPHRRDYLTDQYEKELQTAGFDYFRVSGTGEARTKCAIEIVNRCITPEF